VSTKVEYNIIGTQTVNVNKMASSYDILSGIASSSAATATTVSSPLVYNAALQVGKHGLKMMAVSGTASLVVPPIITTIRGGGGGLSRATSTSSRVKKQQQTPVQKKNNNEKSSFKFELTPQGKSVAWMALGMVSKYKNQNRSAFFILRIPSFLK
jgi:hypothetical protein